MTLKDFKNYLNALDLNEINEDIVIVSCTRHFQSGAEETVLQCDGLGEFILNFSNEKPMLYVYTDEAIDFLSDQED